jgi:hypothetical protein
MKITQRARRTAIALVAAAAIGGSGAAVGAAATAPTPPRSWRASLLAAAGALVAGAPVAA